jgi:uncharacterized NAD(P)/FAD-binding protein YdhS
MRDRWKRPVVAIVGGGFSGIMTAIHLLRESPGPLVRLIERRDRFGLGTAYSTRSDNHLLNVRAHNMSAFPDDPGHFTAWLARSGDNGSGSDFVTRSSYGRYLQNLLRSAIHEGEAGRLLLEADAAVSVKRAGGRWRVGMAMGRSFTADVVVLALGNLPPSVPPGLALGVTPSAGLASIYVADPWRMDFAQIPSEGTVMLLGTGLTAVDVALDIAAHRPKLHMLALSRHGLLPRSHAGDAFPSPLVERPEGGALALLRHLRAQAQEGNWRDPVDTIRPHVQSIWRAWPSAERGRFLRHLSAWWGVHRHRLAPKVASRLAQLIANDVLEIAAGRLIRLETRLGSTTAVWRPRGTPIEQHTVIRKLINCTGPNERLEAAEDPLIKGLYGGGVIRQDEFGLGADVDAQARVIGRDGLSNQALFAIGPIARGALWEITSVPDIRGQAASTATAILRTLGYVHDQESVGSE